MADATSETGQHRGSILEGVDGFGTHPQPGYAGMRAGGPARRAHASQQAALRYQHATEQRDRAIADALDGIIRAGEDGT